MPIDPPITSAYIHIPFCRRRCFYCDFPIAVVGDRPPLQRSQGITASATGHGSGAIAHYIPLLCQEIRATAERVSHGKPVKPLQTVFFGGGTPSLLGVEQLEVILETLSNTFGIVPGAELSMEMDPGTFTLDQLQGYQNLGINRVSLGVQSFDDKLLQACGRTHTLADIHQAFAAIAQVGITNWSLDLISGLPHLTLEHWHKTLEQAVHYQPPHISVYDLTVEPNTAFDRWYQPGEAPLPSDSATTQMYRMAQQHFTAAGYDHYEISNYARPGYTCRHNLVYWRNQPYYGFGMGAASYVNRHRISRPRTSQAYGDWVQQGAEHSAEVGEPTALAEQLLDTLMLGLRLAEGVRLRSLTDQFGVAIAPILLKTLAPHQAKGWVETTILHDQADRSSQASLSSQPDMHIRLSDPDGFLFSNVVLSDLFEALDAIADVG
ncbi:MAG: coproporphyrinogen III oxidase [Cyanothece sp. SIO2G6]|nr:coproporphyrinogen III oxidase [Cyanothece sp. SIO2G6]